MFGNQCLCCRDATAIACGPLAAHEHPHMFTRCPNAVLTQFEASSARRTIQILETLRSTCPDAQFILRGLGPKTSDPDSVWPNVYTVVWTLPGFCPDM